MRLRSFRNSDIGPIDEIWRAHHSQDFSVPDRKNAIIDAVVEDEAGKLVAYGQVRVFAEAQIILDLSATRKDKVQAVILLMHEAFRGVKLAGIEDIYAFIKDPDFAQLIKKHFDFEIVNDPGELLLRRVE
jgi:hypothetical protein